MLMRFEVSFDGHPDLPMIADCRLSAVHNPLILKVILLLICLAGCASKPVPGAAPLKFEISGKFGIRDGDEGYSARFNWQQSHDGYAIEVWGPLGQGRTRLEGDEAMMQVLRGREVVAQGEPEMVMAASLGWSVPIHVLPAWIGGEPAADIHFAEVVYDAEGRYAEFVQAGWQVSLTRYQQPTAEGALSRPARIVAEKGARKVTVIVRDFAQ
jgi:outer membrane lipoprotein LolB